MFTPETREGYDVLPDATGLPDVVLCPGTTVGPVAEVGQLHRSLNTTVTLFCKKKGTNKVEVKSQSMFLEPSILLCPPLFPTENTVSKGFPF